MNSIMRLKPFENKQLDLTTFDEISQGASDTDAVHMLKLIIFDDPYVSVRAAKIYFRTCLSVIF